jgi:hypothetical protein
MRRASDLRDASKISKEELDEIKLIDTSKNISQNNNDKNDNTQSETIDNKELKENDNNYNSG